MTTATAADFPAGTILGYPRIGPNRELKKAVEAAWKGAISYDELEKTTHELRLRTVTHMGELGLGTANAAIPSSFSYYDQVLDAVALLGAVPVRFRGLLDANGALDLPGYFTVARGEGERAPLEMTKWFDTNYHYLVPEIGPDTPIRFASRRIVDEFAEAKAAGVVTRPVVVGPVTFLALSKPSDEAGEGYVPLTRLDDVVAVYAQLLAALAQAGAPWVQFDEPALVSDNIDVPTAALYKAVERAYATLTAVPNRPAILVAAPFGGLGDAWPVLAGTNVEAIAIDCVKGEIPAGPIPGLSTKTLVAGVINGHNIWRADLNTALDTVEKLGSLGAAKVVVGTSTSLQHVPHTVLGENGLPAEIFPWLAFADEKISEVTVLAQAITAVREAVKDYLDRSSHLVTLRDHTAGVHVPAVRARTASLTQADFTRPDYAERQAAQQARFHLPSLPTTTIGSFPQTAQIRKARAANAKGELSAQAYEAEMRAEIDRVIDLQERLDIDVLVHGEPERNDMVQYFAENFDGFAVTKNGWVQSYGSRATRPPILWGDVSRPAPITVKWAEYAQSRSSKPVKGMLTGPVTILAWSFVRDDQPLGQTANQVALALRDEIADLQGAGIGIIQVDEPALRELLPLRKKDQDAYLDWSVGSFRLATAGAAVDTQVHTHLCYSEFGEVIGAIDRLDADVTSVEAARSRMEIVPQLQAEGFSRGIGPGVYDIHSPRVPSQAEIEELLRLAVAEIGGDRVWANPDCGLKTRGYAEVEPALEHLVAAAKTVRAAS